MKYFLLMRWLSVAARNSNFLNVKLDFEVKCKWAVICHIISSNHLKWPLLILSQRDTTLELEAFLSRSPICSAQCLRSGVVEPFHLQESFFPFYQIQILKKTQQCSMWPLGQIQVFELLASLSFCQIIGHPFGNVCKIWKRYLVNHNKKGLCDWPF